MSATLPLVDPCCLSDCDDPLVVNVPGPTGDVGADGADGTDGINAYTTLAVAFTMPAELATATATVGSSVWMTVGQILYVQTLGHLEVTAVPTATTVTLRNLENNAVTPAVYTANAAALAVAPINSKVSPAGLQGATGTIAGAAAGGDLKGTYLNPLLARANVKGTIIVGNGTDATDLAAGGAGFIPVDDVTAFAMLRVGWKKIIPITADTNVAIRRIPRLSAATGLPIPLEASKATIAEPGAAGIGLLVGDATTGDARGTDAVDLQVNRLSADRVASGARSFIGAGEDCKASATDAVAVGGQSSLATGTRSGVVSGQGCQATGQESFVGGGQTNLATNTQSAVVGGDTNFASGLESFVGGGKDNQATALDSAVTGGNNNVASGSYSFIGGGISAEASLYGQSAHASGVFAVRGDAQTSQLDWRILTTDATANVELFLDGAAVAAIVPTNTTWLFEIMLIARSSTGVSAAWRTTGAIRRIGAATAALVAAVATSVLADGTGATWGVAGSFTVDADAATDKLRLRVTGAAATNIRWHAHARLIELAF